MAAVPVGWLAAQPTRYHQPAVPCTSISRSLSPAQHCASCQPTPSPRRPPAAPAPAHTHPPPPPPQEPCIALDTEHHALHSYHGLVCLLQLSTGREDWVVDTLALHGHVGPAFGPLAADPGVVKVRQGGGWQPAAAWLYTHSITHAVLVEVFLQQNRMTVQVAKIYMPARRPSLQDRRP